MRQRSRTPLTRRAAAIFGLTIGLLATLLVIPIFSFNSGINEGDIATHTLEAARQRTFTSEGLTEAARKQAADAVEEVALPLDPAQVTQQSTLLSRYLTQVQTITARSDSKQAKLDAIAALSTPNPMTNAGRLALVEMDRATLEALSVRATRALSEVHNKPLQQTDITARIDDYLASLSATVTAPEAATLGALLRAFVTPTFQVDTAATQAKRQEARDRIAPIVVTYNRGQVVVNEGQRLKAEDIEVLKATGVIDDAADPFAIAAGVLAALGLGLLLAACAYRFQPFPAPHRAHMLLIAIPLLLLLIVVRIVTPPLMPDTQHHGFAYALPIAAAAIVAAIFTGVEFAAVIALATGLFAVTVAAFEPELAGASFIGSLEALQLATAYTVGGLAGAIAIGRAERLSRFAIAAGAVTAATAAVLLIYWLVDTPRINEHLLWAGGAALLNGVLSSGVALAAYLALAPALGLTTRFRLVGLTQAEHPALRRLQDEAPGTYHHSILVGSLAERAAARIGADPLLARVGAYFHDLGKLAKPPYYIENTLDGAESPHTTLDPVASAAIIRQHVTAGLDLARRYHLPQDVQDFIPQHHGTRLVAYFYRRAAESGTPNPADFRYPGPKPQTREAAIVMLADSCEAFARAGRPETVAAIDGIVDTILAERLAEGQMDECDITMAELHTVAESFKTTLRAIYHPRVPYPDPTPEELANFAGA